MRSLLLSLLLLVPPAIAQSADSDRDGLPDTLEDALLQRFAPHLQVAADDCSVRPASFQPGHLAPIAIAADGTVYGQATPRPNLQHIPAVKADVPQIELHFYHLWRRDCGRLGHDLDAEHIAALLQLTDPSHPDDPGNWRAIYWYAAAHEDTVCDAGHLARASTLNAESQGAKIWVSSGKHGSFLTEAMCTHGCGSDRCERMVGLSSPPVINLGELHAPMNGAIWSASAKWPGPLSSKMERSDFLPDRTARVDRLPETDIAWANPAKRPAQGAILGANAGIDGALIGAQTGSRSTDTALTVAGDSTGNALGTAAHNTGQALSKSWRNVRKALGGSKDTDSK